MFIYSKNRASNDDAILARLATRLRTEGRGFGPCRIQQTRDTLAFHFEHQADFTAFAQAMYEVTRPAPVTYLSERRSTE
jgi:hypothetical protein